MTQIPAAAGKWHVDDEAVDVECATVHLLFVPASELAGKLARKLFEPPAVQLRYALLIRDHAHLQSVTNYRRALSWQRFSSSTSAGELIQLQ